MKTENQIQVSKTEEQVVSLLSSSIEFTKIYNPKTCLRVFKDVGTIEKSLKAKTPTLGKLSKQYGDVATEAYLRVWLVNLNDSLNLKRPLSENQIDETAFLIVSDFKNISISDINLIFKRAKFGDYGSFYESISIDKVLTWFRKYFEERCEVAASISRMESDKRKYSEDKTLGSKRTGMQQLRDASMINKHKKK